MFHGMGQTPADFAATQSNAPQNASDLASAAPPQECDPTQQVCEWYCYIPFFPSADCWTSFESGVQQGAQSVGSAAGGTVSAAATGVVSGLASGLTNSSGSSSGAGLSLGTGLMFAGIGIVAALVLLTAKK